MTEVLIEKSHYWLSEHSFFYDGHTYALSKIKRAYVKRRLLKPSVLAVEFKSGSVREFSVEPTAERWALAINLLMLR